MTGATRCYVGLAYRAHHPAWAFAPLSGEGAARFGGRFNQPGMDCLYLSLSFEGAWREAQQGFAFKTQPLTLCTYKIDCEDIADLSTDANCALYDVDPGNLAVPWERLMKDSAPVPSWEIASRLAKAGCAGIIVPSYASGGRTDDRNLVLWEWSDRPPHRIVVVDDEGRLPKDQSSWGTK